ncbi:hypothetical protein N7495_000920 [Penicillium taxi]|uniref:uncharacterized protein n=1 Tax=Penicillium taxi TaxID=168475 RepID=UPI0025452313|nr:uncharacterized protein N7495_000920 [Penicillium taxi]KAJ5908238.1 hypothetical protein N7495_000920 [Penicillium taxi]
MSAVMEPNVSMSDAVSYAFTILRDMKEDGNIPSCDYYERLQRTRACVGRMREASKANIAANNNGSKTPEQMFDDTGGGGGGDCFLSDNVFVWPDGMLSGDHSLRDVALELGDEFLLEQM